MKQTTRLKKLVTAAATLCLTGTMFIGCDKLGGGVSESPDLSFNDLKGPVKMVTTYDDWGYGRYKNGELFYDSDGTWLNRPRWEGEESKYFANTADKTEKDKDGYIVKTYEMLADEGDMGELQTTTYIWENGRLKQKNVVTRNNPENTDEYYSSQSITTYTYDSQGMLTGDETHESYSSSWSNGTNSTSHAYAYTDMDEKGNWVKRNVLTTSQWGNSEPSTSNSTETREILYY